VASLSSVIGQFGFASGPGGTRRLWIGAGIAGAVIVAFVGVAVYRTQSSSPSSVLQTVPRTQNGTGFSGSDQVRRSNLQQEESTAADQARRTGQTSVMSPEDSYPAERQRRLSNAVRNRPNAPTSPTVPPPNDDMTRGYLIAMNQAMAGMATGIDVSENFDETTVQKERADDRAAVEKASLSSAGKVANAGRAAKHGLGLAGQRVMATTVLAATMDPDSGKTPAVVQMTSGPLAGYRLEGTIDKHDNGLTIPIETLYYNDQKIPVKAMLISPETQEVSVACDVNHHTLLRIGLPAAIGALQGLGQAAQMSGSTFAAGPFGGAASYSQFSPWQIGGVAAGGAAQGVQSVLHDALPKGSTVTLCADVSVEVYFEDDVYLRP
jgi:hypothetical protein